MSTASRRSFAALALAAACTVTACDHDPVQPNQVLALVQCPVGPQLVNAPIVLTFTEPLLPAAVTPANIVVTDAKSGFEFPGSARLSADDSRQVVFTPASPFPFDTTVSVRVQNLLPASNGSGINVTVCTIHTELPPIRELFWRALPSAGGNALFGVSLVEPNYGYVVALANALFRYADTTTATSIALPAYYSSSQDVSFVSRDHGFVSVFQPRTRRNLVIETQDGGATFDTLLSVPTFALNRVYFRPLPTEAAPFGIAAGGSTFGPAAFYKYDPASKTFAATIISGTGPVGDVDFTRDTVDGAATTYGTQLGSSLILGTVFHSTDGGASWQEITNARAPDSVLTYRGVAVKTNGEIFVVGGNGYVGRLTPSGSGGYSIQQIILPITNPDTHNRSALLLNDVQFAPDNDQIGWIVGAQQTGIVDGTPRYQGIIFMTRDGGATWTRQGVLGAPNYGAEIPQLSRLDVLSATAAWAVGNGGTVIRFQGPGAP